MQTITQQRVVRALGFLLAAFIVVPTNLTATPAIASVAGSPGVIPSVRYDGNGPRSVSLSWDAPRTEGSFPVSDYILEYRGAGGAWTVFDDGVSTNRTVTVTGLEAGREYEFRVAAANLAGVGPASTLGIGTNAINSSSGVCMLTPADKFACATGGTPTSKAFQVDDPNGILAPTVARDIVDFAGANTQRIQDLSCGLSKSRGVICAASFNEQGQLGRGYAGAPSGSFVIPGLPDNIVDVTTLRNTACALSASGELWCWGQWSSDRYGRHMMTPTLQFRGVKDIAGNCAIQWDDTVTCFSWDSAPYRWVTNAAFPTATSLQSDSGYNVCAITTSRTVACTTRLNVAFSTIANLNDVVEFDYHALHWCALLGDGTVTCYGNNDAGQLGDGTYASGRTTASVPEPVAHLAISDESGGWLKRSCAIGVSSTLYCWGSGVPSIGNSTVPRVVSSVGGWTAHAAIVPSQISTVTQTGRTAKSVTVAWNAPTAGDYAIDSYSLNWRVAGGSWATVTVPAETKSWQSPEVPVQSTVEIQISATSVAGTGTPSAVFAAVTANPPARPSSPEVTSTTANSVSISWRPVSSPYEPVTGYRIEWSADRQTWKSQFAVAGETTATISGLAAGSAIDIRLSAINAAGASSYSNKTTAYTTGLVSHSIAVEDATGQPVYGGQVTWIKQDGTFQSALDYGLTVEGRATFPFIPAGVIDVTLTDVQLLGGALVDYETSATVGFTTDTVITLPEEPSESQHVVRVELENGLPVVGAFVSVTDLYDVAEVNGATFTSPAVVSEGYTNEFGEVYLSGYSSGDSDVFVEYSDGILIQRTNGPLGADDAVFVLQDMPWVEPPVVTTEQATGSLVTLTIRANATSAVTSRTGKITAGAVVRIDPPAGASQTCKGKQLSATIGTNGIATLKVCASKSGRYVLRGKGVISTGAVSLKVKGAAPMPVHNARAISPSHGNVTVSWAAPTYSGGNSVTKYTVTLKKGKKVISKVVTGTSANFGGLPGTSKWTVTVSATSKGGTSEPVRMVVPVS